MCGQRVGAGDGTSILPHRILYGHTDGQITMDNNNIITTSDSLFWCF